MTEYQIDIDDELWESAVKASGLTDPSEIVDLALHELLALIKLQRDEVTE